ncbi:MAG: universal stress protein [Planctomycetes bacterium]|nr:universal stress protein [Planctomycetota bacterium]
MAKSGKANPISKRKADVSIKKVLCATDLSPCSQHALAAAAEMAEAYDATLIVTHIVELWDARYDFLVKDLGKRLAEDARAQVAQELEHLGKTESVPVEVLIRKGHAGVELVRALKETEADLVVVGSHGKGAIDRVLLGSTAERLLHVSPVSVLIARPSPHPDITRIVAAIEASPTSEAGLDWALDLARREKLASISVVNAFEVPTGYLEAGMTYESARKKMQEIHELDIGRALAKRKGAVKIAPHIEEGPTAETIVKFAGQQEADLLVLGTHGQSRLAAFFLGSVTQKVVRIAPMSVLAVKSPKHRQSILEALDFI